MSLPTSIEIKATISWRKIGKRFIVVNKKNERHYVLNEVGKDAWGFITKGKSLRFAVDKISQEYSITKERAAADIAVFLNNLEKEGIIAIKTDK